jgi:hypothetical protein
MDIELPNGAVIEDIPEGTPKSEIMARAIKAGLAKSEDFGIPKVSAAQPSAQRTMPEELTRQAGLLGRAAVEGFTSPATAVLEGVRGAYNLGANIVGSPSRMPSFVQAQSQGLTSLGVPTPETPVERAAQSGAQAIAGTASLAGTLGSKIPALMQNMTQQLAGAGAAGAAAQPTAEAVKEFTGSDLAATVAALGVGAKAAGVAGRAAGSAMAEKPTLYTMDQIKQRAQQSYAAMDDAGVQLKPNSVSSMIDNVKSKLNTARYIEENDAPVKGVLDRFTSMLGVDEPISFTKLEQMRGMANDLKTKPDANIKRLGSVMVDTIDNYISKINGNDIVSSKGSIDDAVKNVMSARKDWRNASRASVLDDALNVAEAKALDQKASESELIRRGFINIAASKEKMRLFSDSEQNLIKSVAKGGSLDPILSTIGQFNPFRAKLATAATLSVGAASPAAGLGMAAAGLTADKIQGLLRRRAAELATKQIASGAAPEIQPGYQYSGLLGGALTRP